MCSAAGLPLGDFNLEEIVLLHVGRQAREALTPTAPHAQQQGIALRQRNDATDAGDVLNCVQEHDQLHGRVAGGIVVLQVLLHHLQF